MIITRTQTVDRFASSNKQNDENNSNIPTGTCQPAIERTK